MCCKCPEWEHIELSAELDGSQSLWCATGRGVTGFRLSVAALEAEGVPLLLEAAASGQLQQRHRFLTAAAADLRVVCGHPHILSSRQHPRPLPHGHASEADLKSDGVLREA